jgi:arginine exporter protein ArgO
MGVSITDLLTGSSQYLSTLRLKIGFYIITVLLAFSHDLYFGPKSATNSNLKKFARIFGVINLIIGLVIIYLAVRLRLGG